MNSQHGCSIAACIIMHRTVYVDITGFPPKSEFVLGSGIRIPSIMWSESEKEPATTIMMVTIIIITILIIINSVMAAMGGLSRASSQHCVGASFLCISFAYVDDRRPATADQDQHAARKPSTTRGGAVLCLRRNTLRIRGS